MTASILIIEDNEDSAEALRLVLEMAGHEVQVATCAEAGLELALACAPDVVLCDLGLPDGLSGYEVAERLRGDPATRGVRLAALSGWGRAEDKERSAQAGFDVHFTKPVDVQQILAFLS